MRTVSAETTAAWLASYKGGDIRPCARATIQPLHVAFTSYDRSKLKGATSKTKGTGTFASLMFGQRNIPKELPNVRSVSWNRGLDADISECTITLWNTSPLPIGQAPEEGFAEDFDRPGWYTFDRGKTAANTRWGTTKNKWQNLLVPDRVIRTYEGYGHNPGVCPELDTHLYQSGCWLIDEVDYTHDGIITLRCRDYGRVLLDHIMFPPVVPWSEYPLSWEKYHNVKNKPKLLSSTGSKWFRPTYQTDSNIPYIGKGFTDGGRPYVSSDGAVLGHHGRHAVDGSASSYWMSVGNMPSWSSSYEYVQGSFSKRSIAAVKVKPWGGPYTCYVSVKVGGKWLGGRRIPYGSRAVDTSADIPYVTRKRVDKGEYTEIALPKAYADATAVRITFTDLYDSGIGYYRWRAGLKDLQVLTQTHVTTKIPNGTHVEGNYGDYSDIVAWLLAWAGFFWPESSTGQSFLTYSNGDKVNVIPVAARYPDPLPKGRLWGDWMPTGTYGLALDGMWDKKPIMDGIRFVQDIVGFNFWIDETGGAVWRLPNIFSVGNYRSGVDGGQYESYTATVVTVDETTTLQSLRAILSSKNVRERVFIASTDGKSGAVAKGYTPKGTASGLRRVGGWTDQHFRSDAECQVMADMITIRQMFQYRTDNIVIPANPSIQIDDQIRIYERTTAETYLHYVTGIASEMDLTTGKWTYEMQTHWLGEDPGTDSWFMDRRKLSAETQKYIAALGQ